MSITLWRKHDPLNGQLTRWREEMDRTFDRFFGSTLDSSLIEPKLMRTQGWIPAIDVSETEGEVTVRAEVPGIGAADLEISVSRNMLIISGEKDETSEKKEENFYQCERRFGSFRRAIELPESAETDKVTAESENGVVTIRVPKKAGAKARHVEVKPAASAKVAVKM